MTAELLSAGGMEGLSGIGPFASCIKASVRNTIAAIRSNTSTAFGLRSNARNPFSYERLAVKIEDVVCGD